MVSIKTASWAANVPGRGQLLGGFLCRAGSGRGHPPRHGGLASWNAIKDCWSSWRCCCWSSWAELPTRRTCRHCQIYSYMTAHSKKVIIILAGFLLSICNKLHTFILVFCLEKRSLDKLGLRAFQCRSGQVIKAQTFYDLFLMYTFCITLVFHTSLAVMLIAAPICLSSVLLWGSLMDNSTLHLGAERWWRMTSWWWWWRRQAFDMHWRRWSRESHSPV